MKHLTFLGQYLLNPRSVGAVAPSSRWLCEKMIASVEFSKANCIVEYGAGTGVFTEVIVTNKRMSTLLISFETNVNLYNILRKKYKDKENIIIVNDSAENIDYYLQKYNVEKIDYVVSGLPFASLPSDVSERILKRTAQILDKRGMFITFQYTTLKEDLIKKFFSNINKNFELRNIPPAFVFICTNNKGNKKRRV